MIYHGVSRLLLKAKGIFWIHFLCALLCFSWIGFSTQAQTIKVNLFGGLIPYSNTQWNNWNSGNTTSNSQLFKYSTGSQSTVYARLNSSDNIGDNGSTYGGSMCPPEVLRHTSFSANSRILTIYGLDPTKKYSITLYSSRKRTDGQRTIFAIGTKSVTIATDNNLNNAAKFLDVIPNSSGQVVISISKPSNLSFNYLNGFEISQSGTIGNSPPQVIVESLVNVYSPANSVTLNGNATDADGFIATYLWEKKSGPDAAILNPGSQTTDVNGLTIGEYIFQLTATDNSGGKGTAEVVVKVSPWTPPHVDAGPNVNTNLPADSAILKGTVNSFYQVTSVQWSLISGPSVPTIKRSNDSIASVSGLIAGTYSFLFSATDINASVGKDTLMVFVNQAGYYPPALMDTLNCGVKIKVVVLGSSHAFGTGTDPIDSSWVNKYRRYLKSINSDNEIVNLAVYAYTSYQVLCPTGFVPPAGRPSPVPANNITAALGLNPDVIIINLPTNDIANGYTMQEQIDNFERAVALAADRNIPVWVTTSMPRNFSADKQNQLLVLTNWIRDRFGKFAVNFWDGLANSSGGIIPEYGSGDGVHLNNLGHHILFTRAVGEQISDFFCQPGITLTPSVSAGNDMSFSWPQDNVVLNGFLGDASSVSSIYWTQLSGPSTAKIHAPANRLTKVTGLVEGKYVFRFRASNIAGLSGFDDIAIDVLPAQNNNTPTVDAGIDQSVRLPVSSVRLIASATDSDGEIQNITWSKNSGPSAVIASASSLATDVGSLQQGKYVFRITVTDNLGASAFDDIIVDVLPAFTNSVAAGDDRTIQLPQSSVQLNGFNGNEFGTNSILWKQVQGPGGVGISNASLLSTEVSGLTSGVFLFELSIENSYGNVAADTLKVTVLPAVGLRQIQVNLYKGVNPYQNSSWNNWTVSTSPSTSSVLKFTDGSSSGVTARLSASDDVSDNGTTYGGIMCPPGVLRHGSYFSGQRSLTLNNLNASRTYTLEFYASRKRTDNQRTTFSIGTRQQTVISDNNLSNVVSFSGVSPNSLGSISVTLSSPSGSSFNYLNGFVIKEELLSSSVTGIVSPIETGGYYNANRTGIDKRFVIWPNPSSGKVYLSGLPHDFQLVVVLDNSGRVVFRERRSSDLMRKQIELGLRVKGLYVVQIYCTSGLLVGRIVIQ